VKLDFGLSSSMLSDDAKSKWPYEFGLVYSVTLSREGLGTSLQVRNQGSENFEFQVLLHTYLAIEVCIFLLLRRSRSCKISSLYEAQWLTSNAHRTSQQSKSNHSKGNHTSTKSSMPLNTPRPRLHYKSPQRRTASTRTSTLLSRLWSHQRPAETCSPLHVKG
jgi:galactose mutarotase-like enzyme